jgi:serine/threonine-protein kinase
MVGQNIGKYRVADRVGRGGMGTVYRAVDETLHREVAIKVLNAELNDPEIAKRFRAEAITVARLSHPGIATIYELFQHETQWLMVMEFVRGETLERLVERMGPLSPQRAAEMCMQALAALAHAHSMGVVHRDLKPANLMITETGSVKIMDFGIARVSGTEHLTNAGYMMGTPAYMAPEQVLGKELDARADLYALGVVFYRLVTKALPFKGESPFALAQSQVNEPPTPVGVLRTDLPPWVDQVIVRALAKNPEERFQSAVEFHEGLARCLAGLPLTAPTYSPSAPTELMLTPARAMPTGTLRTPTGIPGGNTAPSLPSQPVMQAGAPATGQAMATMAGAADPSRAATMLPPSQPSGAVPKARGSMTTMLALAGAVLVALIALGWWAVAGNRAGAIDIVADVPASPAPLAPDIPLPLEPPSTPIEAPGTTAAPPGTAPGGTAVPGTAPGAAGPGSTTAAPGATSPAAVPTTPSGGGTARPAIDDTPLAFNDVRVVLVTGRDGRDQDAQVMFGDGRVAVLPRVGGNPLAAIPYSGVVTATYTRGRDPKWDPAGFSPPANLNTPGTMFRRAAHWLVLQSADAYVILRLEDSNWERILAAVEARTGLKIARS